MVMSAYFAMQIWITLFVVTLMGMSAAFSAPPPIPRANEVVRYERVQPVFQSKEIAKERGDELLSALDGGRQIRERQLPPGVVCALPVPARHWLSVTLTNGSVYRIGVSFGGGLVYLPEGLYEVTDAARDKVTKAVNQLDEDLRKEIVNAPKPLIYTVSMLDDGGTLSGISRLFYGDATKWRKIYDANRNAIKNPNVIDSGMKLTIPKLQ